MIFFHCLKIVIFFVLGFALRPSSISRRMDSERELMRFSKRKSSIRFKRSSSNVIKIFCFSVGMTIYTIYFILLQYKIYLDYLIYPLYIEYAFSETRRHYKRITSNQESLKILLTVTLRAASMSRRKSYRVYFMGV
jgi:hypothetical protein